MNGTKARGIRKKIYGEGSKRSMNEYGVLERVKTFFGKDKEGKEKEIKIKTGQLICTGKRAEYKKAKRAYLKAIRSIKRSQS